MSLLFLAFALNGIPKLNPLWYALEMCRTKTKTKAQFPDILDGEDRDLRVMYALRTIMGTG